MTAARETCPYCTRDLTSSERHGQYCDACDTRPFGAWRRRRRASLLPLTERGNRVDDLARLLYARRAGPHGDWREINQDRRDDLVEEAADILEALERLGWRVVGAHAP